MKTKPDYMNKPIFVGIDVHKKTYSIAIVCDGDLVKKETMSAKPDRLVVYLKKRFIGAQIYSAYEAGFSGFGLHRSLIENGINNIVVHASAIEVGARERVKNDTRDATKIAAQLAAGRLKGIYVPPPEVIDRRELSRHREELVKERSRVAVKFKMKAYFHSLIAPEDTKVVCQSWIEQILKKEMGLGLRAVMEDFANQWMILNEKIQKFSKLLQEQAKQDPKHESVYRNTVGIGPTAARELANELGDMSQFSSTRKLSSYTGLTPREYSSGEKIRRGHISRQGNPRLRGILVECAWTAIRYDQNLKDIYDRIKIRAGAKRAIVAIARRIICRIRACFRSGAPYQKVPVKKIQAA